METVPVDLVRTAPSLGEIRAETDSVMPTMVVRFSQFDTWYEVSSFWEGDFMERTAKGAFRKTIREDRGAVKVLFNHGFDGQISDKVLGPIDDLREDADSPVGEVPLFDTAYNRELLPGLEAGVYGSSFRMRVIRDEWNDEPDASEHNPKGLPERTIKEVRLFEFGPVTFPANPEATASLRSATDEYYRDLRRRDERAFDEAARAAGITDFTGRPRGARGGGDDHDKTSSSGGASVLSIDPSTRDRVLRAIGALRARI